MRKLLYGFLKNGEEFITTKQQYLLDRLLEAEVTAQAYAVGLVAHRYV